LLAYRRPNGAEVHLPLERDVTTIGRSDNCDLVIPLSTVSRLHARIELQYDHYILSDAGSANGTYVNGERIEDGHQLSTEDEIWLGTSNVVLRFSDPDETLGVMQFGDAPPLVVEEEARMVYVYGVPAQLTTLEYELLRYLAHHPRKVCTREACFQAAWGQPYDHLTCEYALNACIARLRRNLRAAAEQVGQPPPQIVTIKRIGFRLDGQATFSMPTRRSVVLKERAVGR
jgi:DNA-binding winged helix-turn-helix (wHTH) protein